MRHRHKENNKIYSTTRREVNNDMIHQKTTEDKEVLKIQANQKKRERKGRNIFDNQDKKKCAKQEQIGIQKILESKSKTYFNNQKGNK